MYIRLASGTQYHPKEDLKILHRNLTFFPLEIQTEVFRDYFETSNNLNEQVEFDLAHLSYKFNNCALHTKFFMDPYQLLHKIHIFLQTRLDFHQLHRKHQVYLLIHYYFLKNMKSYLKFSKQYILP
jgi:hypothetical protein